MVMRTWLQRTAVTVSACALLVGGSAFASLPAAEAAQSTDAAAQAGSKTEANTAIRVALFGNLGKSTQNRAGQVTLSSEGVLSVKSRSASGQVALGTKQARFSLDGYQVKLFESKDKAAAQAVLKRAQASNSAYMIQIPRRGATFYAVYAGSYATEAQASKALANYQADGTMKSLTACYSSVVAGPNYWQAGTYGSQAEANAARNALLNANIEAYTVTIEGEGAHHTAVWAGQAGSQAALSQLKASIQQALPGAAVREVQAQGALIHSLEDTGSGTIARYSVYGTQKWALSTDAQSIKVSERSGRSYRGMMELSSYNDELALVNELPLEQYLVSVVGGEIYPNWPEASLKAQAVAARTFVLYQGNKFGIANVVDTTLSQAYNGLEKETDTVRRAVESTAGEVLMSDGKLIEAIFNSNAGGMTAEASEVWGGGLPWAQATKSPDEGAEAGKYAWYYVALEDGKVGYVREDVVQLDAGRDQAGFQIARPVEDNTNIRPFPAVQSNAGPIASVKKNTRLIVMDTVKESNAYSWIRGPYTATEVLNMIQSKTKTKIAGPLNTLTIAERGPSGRATKIEANGVPVEVSYPDAFRSVFGGLPSTMFDIVSTKDYAVMGSDGKAVAGSGISGKQAIGGNGSSASLKNGTIVVDGQGKGRVLNAETMYIFKGKGYGHGIGMSQWGAKGLADQGYDYEQILKYYYKNVELVQR